MKISVLKMSIINTSLMSKSMMSISMMNLSMMNTTHYEAEYHEPLNMSLISNIMTKMSLDMIMRNMRMMKMNMWT